VPVPPPSIYVCGVHGDKFSEISGSRRLIVEAFVLLRCYAAVVVGICATDVSGQSIFSTFKGQAVLDNFFCTITALHLS